MPSYDERLMPKVISSKNKVDVFIIRVLWTELRMSSHKDVFDFVIIYLLIAFSGLFRLSHNIFTFKPTTQFLTMKTQSQILTFFALHQENLFLSNASKRSLTF